MYFKNKLNRGFSLLELLLVIAIAAGILLFSINRYHQYKQQVFIAATQRDVSLLFEALSRYYHAQNCTQGVFPYLNQDLVPNLISANYLSLQDLQSPVAISQYQAFVIDSQQRTADGKPVYEWRIIALFNNTPNLGAYEKMLGANTMTTTPPSLGWSLSANPNPIPSHTPLWILNGNLSWFRSQQGIQDDRCQ